MRERDPFEMPEDTRQLAQTILKPTNHYRVIAEQAPDVITDDQLAQMYEPTGRIAITPSVLALVTVFQFMECIPDRDAADLVVARIDWKYALHLPLAYTGFDHSDLCNFRKRVLLERDKKLLFKAIVTKLKALGCVKKKGRQRTDSLAVLAAVREMSELETVTETMRVTLRALIESQPEWVARELPASFVEQYVETKPDYRMSKEDRQALMEQTGQDGFWLQDRLAQQDVGEASATVPKLQEVVTLRQVWEQRYERDQEQQGKVRVRRYQEGDEPGCGDLIVNPHDVGVRASKKREMRWQGDKVHITETIDDDEEEGDGYSFITDVTTTAANVHDTEALGEIRGNLREEDVTPREQTVDAGYISGKQLYESEREGIELIGPALRDTSRNELKIEDFQIDREEKVAICPGGHRSVKWVHSRERDGSEAVRVHFDGKICAKCELRDRCTRNKEGRSLHIGEHYERLQKRRAEAQTQEFKQKMRRRAGIEATLSEMVRKHGLRQHRYRGDVKRAWENLMKGAACNLKRMAKALAGEKRNRRRLTAPRTRELASA
jgi:transposase